MKRILTFILLSLFASFNAYATDCGPQAWGDSELNARWCSCMGGSYNYSTTECTGISSGSSSSSSGSSVGSDYSSGNWFCLAKSSKGACGYGYGYASERDAKNRALSECAKYSRSCYIKYCSTSRPSGDPCKSSGSSRSQSSSSSYSNPSASVSYSSSESSSRYQTTTKSTKRKSTFPRKPKWPKGKATCSECDRTLVYWISTGFGMPDNRFFPNWVYEGISEFYACVKITGQKNCPNGDLLVRTLRKGCSNKGDISPDGYESCVANIIKHHG